MSVEEHRARAPKHLAVGVITASNTRTEETDDSGQYAQEALRDAGHKVAFYAVVRDDPREIREALDAALPQASVVIVSGGTGLSPTDVTIETIAPLLQKEIDGFGEIFRALSYEEIGTPAMLSRATAGVIDGKLVACLPGSPEAVRLAMEALLLPELGHIVEQITSGPHGHP
ncbi:MAG: molybdenum cofactor biosynthesis protein B [Thermoplasmata archaeon]